MLNDNKLNQNSVFLFFNFFLECKPNEFACNSGGCVDRRLRCDGDCNCEDCSDDAKCSKYKIYIP